LLLGRADNADGSSKFAATVNSYEYSNALYDFVPSRAVTVLSPQGTVSSIGTAVDFIGYFNGDGIDDFIISGHYKSHNHSNGGSAYIVFGATSGMETDLESLDGTNGFELTSLEGWYDHTGRYVSSAGDINGDGFDDLIVGQGWSSYK